VNHYWIDIHWASGNAGGHHTIGEYEIKTLDNEAAIDEARRIMRDIAAKGFQPCRPHHLKGELSRIGDDSDGWATEVRL